MSELFNAAFLLFIWKILYVYYGVQVCDPSQVPVCVRRRTHMHESKIWLNNFVLDGFWWKRSNILTRAVHYVWIGAFGPDIYIVPFFPATLFSTPKHTWSSYHFMVASPSWECSWRVSHQFLFFRFGFALYWLCGAESVLSNHNTNRRNQFIFKSYACTRLNPFTKIK